MFRFIRCPFFLSCHLLELDERAYVYEFVFIAHRESMTLTSINIFARSNRKTTDLEHFDEIRNVIE